MLSRTRSLLVAAVGLSASLVPAQEPGRLRLDDARPLPTVTTNQRLAETIGQTLQQSGLLRGYRVELACRAGTVEVSGIVNDQAQKDEALRLIQSVPGVERVLDRLTLRNANVIQTQGAQPAPAAPNCPVPAVAPPAVGPALDLKPGQMPDPLPILPPQGAPSPSEINPPRMPPFAWPTYSPYPNFSRVAYPNAYPHNAWPYIGPIYPFPKIPLGWRSVKLEFEDGYWWFSKTATKYDWWRLKYW